jgi:hypothetical protein
MIDKRTAAGVYPAGNLTVIILQPSGAAALSLGAKGYGIT